MNINIRNDSVEISGYVNAVERNSKPLTSRIGKFIERICKGAFSNALKRSDDVHVLLKTLFATKTEVNTLSGRVDDIVSEGGEPNVIESVKDSSILKVLPDGTEIEKKNRASNGQH